MKIEVGKSYLDRMNRLIKIFYDDGSEWLPFEGEDESGQAWWFNPDWSMPNVARRDLIKENPDK